MKRKTAFIIWILLVIRLFTFPTMCVCGTDDGLLEVKWWSYVGFIGTLLTAVPGGALLLGLPMLFLNSKNNKDKNNT